MLERHVARLQRRQQTTAELLLFMFPAPKACPRRPSSSLPPQTLFQPAPAGHMPACPPPLWPPPSTPQPHQLPGPPPRSPPPPPLTQVLLYDLATVRQNAGSPETLDRVAVEDIEEAYGAIKSRQQQQQQEAEDAGRDEQVCSGGAAGM